MSFLFHYIFYLGLMDPRCIDFNALPWQSTAMGASQKVFANEKRQIRLVRFDDQFVEKDWCQKEHIGYILSGEMTIDFNGTNQQYKQGDALWISHGELDKHKLILKKGQFVELILFEFDN